jgi:hypothetical protein
VAYVLRQQEETAMSLREQSLAVVDALNRREFDSLIAAFEEDAVLDLPDGVRVIGQETFRDTLSAYVLRHALLLADLVVMTDEAGFRAAIECTLHGGNARGAKDGGSYSLPAVLVLAREGELFNRLSLLSATRP